MKTIGEIISTARLAQNLSQEEVSKATRIDIKYLEALEKNRFDLLPPPTFTKGFIRNIAKVLGKSPDDLVAIYRRDIPGLNKESTTEVSKNQESISPAWRLPFSRSTFILLIFGVSIFFGYLAFQYRALLIPPPLSISEPKSKAVITSPVNIAGKTSTDSLITVEPDKQSSGSESDVKPDSTGAFFTEINLSPGEHTLTIKAVNRFGRSISETISFTVLSQ